MIMYFRTRKCMFTDKIIGPNEICKQILDRNLEKTIVVGENLSYDNERITIGSPEDILNLEDFDMCVVVILDKN